MLALGAGAALAWRDGEPQTATDARRAPWAFGVVALVAAGIMGAGRLGADVGAVITNLVMLRIEDPALDLNALQAQLVTEGVRIGRFKEGRVSRLVTHNGIADDTIVVAETAVVDCGTVSARVLRYEPNRGKGYAVRMGCLPPARISRCSQTQIFRRQSLRCPGWSIQSETTNAISRLVRARSIAA